MTLNELRHIVPHDTNFVIQTSYVYMAILRIKDQKMVAIVFIWVRNGENLVDINLLKKVYNFSSLLKLRN